MKPRDLVTFRQYCAAAFIAMFSPVSRLLPHAALELAGISAWVGVLLAAPVLLGLVWVVERLLRVEGQSCGLSKALCLRLGRPVGKGLSLLYGLWLVVYAGFLLRSGAERLLSTVYTTGSLGFFLIAMLLVCLIASLGRVSSAVRSAAVLMLLFVGSLLLIYAMALPELRLRYLWPPDLLHPGRLARSAVPVMDVMSPWVGFSFLRGYVAPEPDSARKGMRRVLIQAAFVLLLMVTTVGILGPELALRHQFPFFVMIKDLSLFDVMERFEPVVVVLWVITDYTCLTMLLLSAAQALRDAVGAGERRAYVPFCAGGVLACGFLLAPNAFRFARLSEQIVPAVNLSVVFLLMPFLLLLSGVVKKLKKSHKRC